MYAGIFVHKIQLKVYLIAVFVQPSIMTETEQSKICCYKASLVGLWNMHHGTSYTLEHEFTNNQLFSITPEQVVRFMCLKVYGLQLPNFETDIPTKGRSSSLEFSKKAISYFMPNKLLAWNKQTHSWNPTKSLLVNNLIKRAKKSEVRKQGKASNTRRPMKMDEFVELICCLRGRRELTAKYTCAAYFIFQIHMIARLDDVMNFLWVTWLWIQIILEHWKVRCVGVKM